MFDTNSTPLPLSPIHPNTPIASTHTQTNLNLGTKGNKRTFGIPSTPTESTIKRARLHLPSFTARSFKQSFGQSHSKSPLVLRYHPSITPLTRHISMNSDSPSTPSIATSTLTPAVMERPSFDRLDSLDGTSQGMSAISMSPPDLIPSTSPITSGVVTTHHPDSLPPVLSMKRSNPKRLSLSLTLPNSNIIPPVDQIESTGSLVSDVTKDTPLTPGPPKTPSLAMAPPMVRPRNLSRPSLLSLVTQPPVPEKDVPPTPGGMASRTVRPKIRLRSSSSGTDSIDDSMEARSSRSASLGYPMGHVPAISEDSAMQFASSSSSSPPGSTYTSPSTPPLLEHQEEPYANGPIELVPGVFLGAEDSVFHWKTYAGSSSRVRILNVAQEIDDPFTTIKGKGKAKLDVVDYEAVPGRPKVEYAHLSWGHGEGGLADLPDGATLEEIISTCPPTGREKWGFWDAIQWMEEARRDGTPILIQYVPSSHPVN
jgi:hypothetical protein